MADIELIKKLRAETGAGLSDVKEALEISKGDYEAAKSYLAKKGIAKADKRADREANQGIIASYIHTTNKIGVLVEVNSETDFVARSEDFQNFGKNIAMQVCAMSPLYLDESEIPPNVRQEFFEEVDNDPKLAGKSREIKNKIVDAKMKTYAEEYCLLKQKFFKDSSVTIGEMMKNLSGKVGEAIRIKRFVRFEVGD